MSTIDEPTGQGGSSTAVEATPDLPADAAPVLGRSLRSLWRPSLARGVGLLVIAGLILLWPDRTDHVLGILVGLALVVYSASLALDQIRHKDQRTFWSLISISLAGGCAAALLVHPVDSLRSVAQIAGLVAIGGALIAIVRMIRRRTADPWSVVMAFALTLGGVLLLAYPLTLLAAATSIVALAVGGAGLIEAFAPDDEAPADPESPLPVADAVLAWIRRRPDAGEDLDSLREKVFFEGPTSAMRYVRFATLMVLAACLASLGVVVESTAVVIGAMLVAPLMTPLMGTALSAVMGWPRRMRRCIGIAGSGVVIAIGTGALVGALVPQRVDLAANTEVLARVSPTVVDLAIALAAGAAGAYALSRRDVSDALPGVAVAISLVPPLTVVGLNWQQGYWIQGNGALLLFLTNAAAILLAGGTTFVLVGVAPFDRIAQSRDRVLTLATGTVGFVALIALLLLVNGSALARAQLAQATVDRTIGGWIADHADYEVVGERTLGDGTIVIDLTGPGEPPGVQTLATDLAGSTGVEVRIRWSQQQQVSAGG